MIREFILIYKIWKWHKKTFEGIDYIQQKNKFLDEVSELVSANKNYKKSPYPRKPGYSTRVMEETADVIIAGLNLLKYPEIYERVAVKHNINTHRTWKNNHHIGD